jgi:hypothetical protein
VPLALPLALALFLAEGVGLMEAHRLVPADAVAKFDEVVPEVVRPSADALAEVVPGVRTVVSGAIPDILGRKCNVSHLMA